MSEEKTIPNAAVGSSPENAFKVPDSDRRSFLSWLSIGWLAYIGVTGGFFTIIVRFLFPNVLFEPPQTFKIGFPDDFSTNSVDIKFKKQFPFMKYGGSAKRGNFNHRLDVFREENMAWDEGEKLAQFLGIKLDYEWWLRHRNEALKTYIEWM